MGWWHLGQVGWAPRAMRASHSCLSFWCWCPYPRWVVVPLALFMRRLCSLQYRSLGWTSFGHRVYAQTLRLMVCVTCLVLVGASCGVRTRYYSLEGWCDSGFTNDAWRAVMLAGLDSGVESLTAHVCIGRRVDGRGDCFHYLVDQLLPIWIVPRNLNDSQGTMRINDSIISRGGINLLPSAFPFFVDALADAFVADVFASFFVQVRVYRA